MDEYKSAQINFRCTPMFLKLVKKLAKKHGVSQSDLLERMIEKRAKREKVT